MSKMRSMNSEAVSPGSMISVFVTFSSGSCSWTMIRWVCRCCRAPGLRRRLRRWWWGRPPREEEAASAAICACTSARTRDARWRNAVTSRSCSCVHASGRPISAPITFHTCRSRFAAGDSRSTTMIRGTTRRRQLNATYGCASSARFSSMKLHVPGTRNCSRFCQRISPLPPPPPPAAALAGVVYEGSVEPIAWYSGSLSCASVSYPLHTRLCLCPFGRMNSISMPASGCRADSRPLPLACCTAPASLLPAAAAAAAAALGDRVTTAACTPRVETEAAAVDCCAAPGAGS